MSAAVTFRPGLEAGTLFVESPPSAPAITRVTHMSVAGRLIAISSYADAAATWMTLVAERARASVYRPVLCDHTGRAVGWVRNDGRCYIGNPAEPERATCVYRPADTSCLLVSV